MRLFIAFEIPEDVSKILSVIQSKLSVPGKATLTRSFHLTLKFLGEVDEKKISIIVDVLKKIQFRPFTANLSSIGAFPNTNNPRVVWVGLEPHDVINAIQKDVDLATQKLGFEQDNKFHPHLTLARIKFINDKKALQDSLNNIKVPKAEFNIDSFKLIKSTLRPEGPEYEILEAFSAQH